VVLLQQRQQPVITRIALNHLHLDRKTGNSHTGTGADEHGQHEKHAGKGT
jgi:hypothetical protein